MAPPLRSPWSSNRIFACFVVASIPAAAVGIWNLGTQILQHTPADNLRDILGWRGTWLTASGLDLSPDAWLTAMLLGLSYLVPLVLIALAVAFCWEIIFAQRGLRTPDRGWIMTAWLFALMLQPGVPLWMAALGLSFGVVVGAHIFGGTGKYLVSPALLGVLFLHFSYPGYAQTALPVDGFNTASSWSEVASAGVLSLNQLLAYGIGAERGALATGSALACLLGAIYLVYAGAVSWRVLAGGVAGVAITAFACSLLITDNSAAALPWYAHLVVGNLAFALIFVATDPSSGPLTRSSRWIYGGAIGAFAVCIRVLDPSHPEGALFAILLAALSVPLLDYLAIRRYISSKAKLSA
jgi:Na+-transporting NADH:ubiquinone oxidoreductase subunit B